MQDKTAAERYIQGLDEVCLARNVGCRQEFLKDPQLLWCDASLLGCVRQVSPYPITDEPIEGLSDDLGT